MGQDYTARPDVLVVDCDTCAGRPRACAECVVSVLIGVPGSTVVAASLLTGQSRRTRPADASAEQRAERPGLDDLDRSALSVLARAGLRPRVLAVRSGGRPGAGALPVGA